MKVRVAVPLKTQLQRTRTNAKVQKSKAILRPRNHWKEHKNRRQLMDELSVKLGIQKQEDWYLVSATSSEFDYSTIGLLNDYYHGSLFYALKSVYPEYEWVPLKAAAVPRNFWTDKKNHREGLDWIARELGIVTQEDWYSITGEEVKKMGGKTLLNDHYNNSISACLQSVYSEFEWKPWLFVSTPKHYFENPLNRRKCVDWIGEQLGSVVNDVDFDTSSALSKVRTSLILKGMKKLSRLHRSYPNALSEYCRYLSGGQNRMYRMLKEGLHAKDVLLNYRFIGNENEIVELDVFIPSLQLAFEYQGEMHYDPSFFQGSAPDRTSRSIRKQQLCKDKGVTLINIPYWWKNSPTALLSTIQSVRPDVFALIPKRA